MIKITKVLLVIVFRKDILTAVLLILKADKCMGIFFKVTDGRRIQDRVFR